MEKLTIGQRFALTCPEGFRTLTKKEREKLNMPGGGESLCLANEAEHIMVSIGWKDVNALAGLLLYIIPPVTSTEAAVTQSMDRFGYKRERMLQRTIGGQGAKGFRYTYAAGGTDMVGESYVIRQGRSLTFFHAYFRAELRDQSLAQWERLLDGVTAL